MGAALRLLDVRWADCGPVMNGIVVIRVCIIMETLVGSSRAAPRLSPIYIRSPLVRYRTPVAPVSAVAFDVSQPNVVRPATSED